MAIRTTRWRPDTCACVVDFEWDDTAAEDAREHTAVAIEACPEHPASGDLAADFATIIEHNRAAQPAPE